jgi:hypothetical protein
MKKGCLCIALKWRLKENIKLCQTLKASKTMDLPL